MKNKNKLKVFIKNCKKILNKKKKRKKRRIRWNNVFLFLIGLIFFIILIICSIYIIDWIKDSKKTDNNIENIQENAEINEVSDNENTEIIDVSEEDKKNNSYWDYIKMNLIDIDFKELKEKNNETVGWIQVNGTNINYPFVQAINNEYYLTHSFNKKTNQAGWVFMDYRNNKNEFDKNTIIYAHGRVNGVMFGTLRKILTNGWLNDTNNFVVKLSTETENTLWQVFSVYKIPTTNDYLQIDFINNTEFIEFGNMLINRSSYNFNTSINGNDKILTLSTCYNENEKVVLHAKLIKKERK